MSGILRRAFVFAALLALSACASNPYLSSDSASGRLSDETVLNHAGGAPVAAGRALLITGNDYAFRSKLAMIKNAQSTLDLMYYIYADDFSSSVISEALIQAARRGVQVRLLVDYHTNYKRLDLFSMLENRARGGQGGLEVRFYNRPTRNIVMDAAYMTMGCPRGSQGDPAAGCSLEKFVELRRAFDAEVIDGQPAAALGISNLNVANSGLFLSGLYAKDPKLMAQAVASGQGIDTADLGRASGVSQDDRRALLQLAKLEWQARAGDPAAQLEANFKLALAMAQYGEKLNPVYAAVNTWLPVERTEDEAARRDWEYLTDFLHHKFLLADGRQLQIGGRNIEDSYHMRANRLVSKYIFMDTDLRVDLSGQGLDLRATFDRLWDFRQMVARLDEVRQHAPNDLSSNGPALAAAAKDCANVVGEGAQAQCVAREFTRRADSLAIREDRHFKNMRDRSQRYWLEYAYARNADPAPLFEVDRGALLAYLENLPMSGGPEGLMPVRTYGAKDGQEARSGKRIHGLWIAALESVCRSASPERPQRVILHNAYFAPPANLIETFGRMVSGAIPCGNVTVTVLTNSEQTTDLVPVNLMARHALKAFAEFAAQRHNPATGARFEYREYLPVGGAGQATQSLHSKVSVLGEDLMVGSANADLRSYLMDSNNAIFIRRAPGLLAHYQRLIDGLLADSRRTVDRSRYFSETPHGEILADDRRTLNAILDKYRAERWLNPVQEQALIDSVLALLDRVYVLTHAILAGDRDGAEEYNRAFKPI